MVDADLDSAGGSAVVVEEAAGQLDGADAVEVDGDPIRLRSLRVVASGGDGAEGAVADIGVAVAVDVEGPVGGAGGDAVAGGEAASSAGGDLVVAEFAVHLAQEVGKAVELAAGGVAPVDHGVVVAVAVGVPPAAEDLAVHGQVITDDVEVSGCGEGVERGIDVASTERIGGGSVAGVLEPVAGGQFGGDVGVAFAQHPEHPSGGDGAVLSGVADETHGGPGASGHVHERVEGLVVQRGGFVDDEDGAGVEGWVVGVGVGEVPGDGLALDLGGRREGAGGFALHRGTDDAVAGGSPGIGAGSDGGGLAGASPADRGLEPVAALAPRPNQVALFTGQMRVAGERGGEVVVGDVVGAFVATGPEPCCDAVLHLEHRSGGEQRLVAVGERDHMTRREEPVGQLEDLGRATEEWLGDTVGIGDPDVRDRGDGVGSGEHRPTGTDPVIGCEESVDGLCPIPLAIRLAIPLGIRFTDGWGEPVEIIAGQTGSFGACPPVGDELVGGGVVLGGACTQHDVFDLAGMRATADLGFELGEGVVDLVAALRELRHDGLVDAVDLPSGLAAGPPSHIELAGELVAHLRGRQRGRGLGVAVQAA